MSLFDFFKKRKPQIIGDTCPYCSKKLEKIPKRKSKCPFCRKTIYIETRFKTKNKILVTEKEAEQTEKEWHDHYFYSGLCSELNDPEGLKNMRIILRKRFGREPSENDVIWGVLNQHLIRDARNWNWGLYSNTRYTMAKLIREEKKLEQSLSIYLEVCYIDLNGPNNIGRPENDPELLEQFPSFDLKTGFIAPGIIYEVKELMLKLNLRLKDVKKIFIKQNIQVQKGLGLPLSPKECWTKIKENINYSKP